MLKNSVIVLFMSLILLVVVSCSSESNVSCPKVNNVQFNTGSTYVDIYFNGNESANSYKSEHGPTGFVAGTGISQIGSNYYFSAQNLMPSTTYDFYVTSICSESEQSQPYKLSSVTTNPTQCAGDASLSIVQLYSVNSIDLSCSYSGFSPEKYDIEYGLQGFTLGSGTKVTTTSSSLSVNNIQPSTSYDFYIRAVCAGNDPSAYKKFQYTSIENCPKPGNLNSYNISGSCNSGSETRAFTWSYLIGNATSYTISLVTNSTINNPDAGNTEITSNTGITFSGLFCLWKAFYVKANCGTSSSSSWAGPYYFN